MAGPGAIVVGGFVNGLGLVRALGAHGIPVVVVGTQAFDIAHRSRWCVEHVRLAGMDEYPERLIDVLDARAASHRGWAVLPSTDEGVAALAPHHERLSSHFRLAAPKPDVARYLLDKRLMMEAARAVGLASPTEYGPAAPALLRRDDLRFPLVVKPRLNYPFAARFGCKLFFASDRDELAAAIAEVEAAGLPADVSAYVAGADSDIYAYCTYLDARGEPHGGVTIRKIRQAPARFGVARVAEIVADPTDAAGFREATLALARRIGLRGIAVAEFKRDAADGVFRFIEINGRSVIYNGLLRRAGLDLAALAWSDYVEGAPVRATTVHWPGVWIHLHADLLHALFNGRREGLGLAEFAAPYRRPKTYGVWSAADPMPFWAEWGRSARRALAALTPPAARNAMRRRGTSARSRS